jgi:hypothetical protein
MVSLILRPGENGFGKAFTGADDSVRRLAEVLRRSRGQQARRSRMFARKTPLDLLVSCDRSLGLVISCKEGELSP